MISYGMSFTSTVELIESDKALLAELFNPKHNTFQVVFADGSIREFEGITAAQPINEDGTMDVGVTVTSEVRVGSIYDAEGAD
jgi:hypothetical protein